MSSRRNPAMERTEAHQRLLEFMRGTRPADALRLTTAEVSKLLDQLVAMEEVSMTIVGSSISYALTDRGRKDDDPPLPVEPTGNPTPLGPDNAMAEQPEGLAHDS